MKTRSTRIWRGEGFESRENIETVTSLVLSQKFVDLENVYDILEPCDQAVWHNPIRKQAEAILNSLHMLSILGAIAEIKC